ncbi:MAG: glycosyltransferase [Hydrogenophaga sp.]|nr:glycosyltransferase [Hydrogenophaga sp.]
MQAVNVLCIKWGRKYGPEYVNKLHSMVSRHLKRPFRFVCLTDDSEGIAPGIEVKPIPMVGFDEFDQRKPWSFGHGWLKLTSFADPLYDLQGRTLFLDLDIVIVDSLDPFFDQEGEFIVIKEWDKKDDTGNTSCYLYTIGAHADALAHLKNDYPESIAQVRNEQEFITQYLARQGKLRYWPAEWCRSFKRHCMRGGLMGWFSPPVIPPGARIIVFHGKPNPPDVIAGVSGKWYRRVIPAAWVADNWR